MESLEAIQAQLKQMGYKLRPYQAADEKELWAIFKEVVDTGTQFPYEKSSKEEFQTQFLGPSTQVHVCLSTQGEIVGGFYLKPNYSDRSGHIANAAYMIKSTHRGQGIGTLLIKASLHLAKKQGFLAMVYNRVLSQNKRALKLYERLSFSIIGIIPQAVRNPDNSFQDSLMLYRNLENL